MDYDQEHDAGMEICVHDIVRDEGSVVILVGQTTDGTDRLVKFAADRRPAIDIMSAIAGGVDVFVLVEPWQIVGA